MRDTFRLGNIRGITLGVHWSLLLFGALAISNLANGLLPSLAPGFTLFAYGTNAAIAVVGLFGSILLHELGHALVAQRADVEVDGITLWLLGGVARLKSDARTAGDAFRIAAAGPVVSVGLGVIGGALALAAWWIEAPALLVVLLGYLAVVNAGLALFNLIPALPLDGGRILQAYLWNRNGDPLDATISAAKVGHTLGSLAVGLGLLQVFTGAGNGLWTMLLGWFVLSGAKRERRRAEAEKRRRQPPVWTNFFDQFRGPGPGSPWGTGNRHPRLGDPIPVRSWEQ